MWTFIKEHYLMRRQLLYMAKTDLIKTYRGAALGWGWALIQPSMMIFVYWFAFGIGWHVHGGTKGASFFLWLVVGLVAWFFMSDMLGAGTRSFLNYRYLVTKMNFPISTIPTFVAMSKMLIHLCLLAVVIIILLIQGDHVSLYWLQLPLYTILMGGFFIAWSLFAAPLAAISKDFANLVRSMVRVLFWMSGIIWSLDTIHNHVVHVIFMFNPITFFANGYRQALLSQGWFFDEPEQLAAFGVVLLVMIGLAYVTFKRARKEIVDAL